MLFPFTSPARVFLSSSLCSHVSLAMVRLSCAPSSFVGRAQDQNTIITISTCPDGAGGPFLCLSR